MKVIVFSLMMLVGGVAMAKESVVKVFSLQVEGRNNLQGVDMQHPRLSWKIQSLEHGVMQTAFQVMVASTMQELSSDKGSIWNSGIVRSDQSLNALYAGDALKSYNRYYWKVKVWTNKGESAWSEIANWSMGILKPDEWKAKWIGLDTFSNNDRPHDDYTRLAARYLRKNISINKQIIRATTYISGVGLYELYINGKKVGNDVLAPTVREYNKAVPYNTIDVTNYLRQGANAVGVILGNGRFFTMRDYRGEKKWRTGIPPVTNYGYPKLLMQTRVEYSDGTNDLIVTDGSWKVTDNGPITANNEYDGEQYNATKEIQGWSQPWFNDASWRNVDLVQTPASSIESQLNENITIKQIIKPKTIHKTPDGRYIIDMGQNMVGWLQIIVKGNKGDTIKMVFAETLKTKDSLYLANIRNAKVTDLYVLKGGKKEQWEPRFTYHGFRYVEVSGLKSKAGINRFIGKVIYDDIATTGSFKSSNETLNDVYRNAYWTIRGNYRGMPTDCPQRDERMGWLGDRSVNSYGESFVFDNARLYSKWMDDIRDAQTDEGSIPDVAPSYWKMYNDNVTWPSSFIIIPEMLRKQFGDTVTYQKNYPYMKKWIMYMWNKYKTNDLILKDNYGDWCLPPESLDIILSKDSTRNTKGPLLASSYFYYSLQLMKQYADRLGLQDDSKQYDDMRSKIYTAFNKMFYKSDSMYYANNTVTSNLLPLAFGLAPEKDRQAIFDRIVYRTENMYNSHVSTGLVGGQWLMRGLSDYGRPDLAYKIATNTTYPSWGYMNAQGATTIWELWNGNTANPAMNSGNHVMLLGDLIVWYYEYLAGIKSDDKDIAFKKIIMKPIFPEGLSYVDASYESRYGLIKSSWKKHEHSLEWDITVPANCSALIYFPTANKENVGLNEKLLQEVHFIQQTKDRSVYEIGSGSYHFSVEL